MPEDDNLDIDSDELPDNQDHLHVNETAVNDDELTEGNLYTVTVDIDKIQHHRGGFNLAFNDVDGNRRSVSFLNWMTNIPDDRFQSGRRATVTHVEYEYDDPFHNLQATSESEVVANVPLEGDEATENESKDETTEPPVEEFDEEAAIDDALSEADTSTPENDTGHAQTTYRSTNRLEPLHVREYVIQVEPGTDPSPSERRKLAYKVVQRVTHETGIPTAKSGELRVVAVNSIDSVNVEAIQGIAGLKLDETAQLKPSVDGDRRQIKRLLEEAFKNRARDAGYRVHGVSKILSSRPIELGVSTNKFQLYDRWDCTIDIGPSGRVYLHVEAKTRVVSDLTLDEISNAHLYPGRRIQTTYGSRTGYYFGRFTKEGAADHEITPGQTVVDYHRANEEVDDDLVDEIEEANRSAVKAYSMGGGGSYTFPQELLTVQGNTKNLSDFAPEFANAARSEWHRSPQQRVEDAHAFACDISEFSVDGQRITLDTNEEVFTGDDRFQFAELYGPRENILTFADGQQGDHPDKTDDLKAYSPPDSFRIAYVYPENFEGERADDIWQQITVRASDLGAEPTRAVDISYEPKERGEGTSQTASRVGAEVGGDTNVDAALCILPPNDDGLFDWAIPYDDLKEVLGDQRIDSQMVHADTLKQPYTHTNLALGLIAAAGGVPFTIEDSLPGEADLVIGLDVGQAFDDDADSDTSTTDGIRVGASTTAIYRDGTILGHTNTGAQTGERIPGRELMRIVRQVVIGYRQRFDEPPEHIVIHRDGFMNDPLDEVEEYLHEEGVSYDIVEVRKRAPARIVNATEYGYTTPAKGVASIDRALNRAYLLTFGDPEDLANRGTPRPITVERAEGSTDIETLARQVYLLSQCHIGVSNTTVRVPISTSYADRAAEAAANGHLPKTTSLETGIGFI